MLKRKAKLICNRAGKFRDCAGCFCSIPHDGYMLQLLENHYKDFHLTSCDKGHYCQKWYGDRVRVRCIKTSK